MTARYWMRNPAQLESQVRSVGTLRIASLPSLRVTLEISISTVASLSEKAHLRGQSAFVGSASGFLTDAEF
jgi:hypothetical protein